MLPEFKTVQFQAGESIFKAGDLAEHLYLTVSGSVELLNKDGVVFATISAGESFGEQAFLAGGIRGASVRAKDAVTCIQVHEEEARLSLATHSDLLVTLLEALLLQQSMNNKY
jgi:CRP-like cAMP-binding protein